jgi:hypothetical protein
MHKYFERFLLLFTVLAILLFFSPPGSSAASTVFQLTIDPIAHQKYGLYYPVTYMFQIPGGSSNLTAQYRYSPGDSWTTLTKRTSADFFNGINAVRFDYTNNIAYISVSFSLNSDAIYVHVLNGSTEVPLSFSGIPTYYDNRQAAVVVSLDDWSIWSNASHNIASGYLTAARIHFSSAIISNDDGFGGPDWASIQSWYDQGYLEPAAHSRTHPCNDTDYQSSGFIWEVSGIRDDILANLTLHYPYVPAYMEPCGFESTLVRQAVANANYIADRGVGGNNKAFTPWGQDGAYQQAEITNETWAWSEAYGPTWLADANGIFDATYTAGGIYHLLDHPEQDHFFDGSVLNQHINYIGNRPDVWYAAFGELYLYHYVQERGQISVLSVLPNATLLSIIKSGTGSGTVTSAPSGIACGTTCYANFNYNTSVTLSAAASAGSTFEGWSGGGCSGKGTCVVNMNATKRVTATFTSSPYTLTVSKSGMGSGSVISVPSGIDCGTTCAANYGYNTPVTLLATANVGSTFAGWGGSGCVGTSSCVVTMDAAKSVTAKFTLTRYRLTVNKNGTGSGTVTSTPAGINCGSTCSALFNYNTSVTLNKAAGAGSLFAGWSGGGCTGTGTCTVTMDSIKSVTATFNLGSNHVYLPFVRR